MISYFIPSGKFKLLSCFFIESETPTVFAPDSLFIEILTAGAPFTLTISIFSS